jgi:type-F conjugative transfer system secretin TraK
MRNKICLFGLLVAGMACGMQVEVDEEHPVSVDISKEGINMVRISQDRIASITAPNNIEAQHNAKTGDIALKALTDKPVDVFLVTEKGRHLQLHLLPTNIAAANIVLQVTGTESAAWELGQPYTKILVELLKAMYNQHKLEGYQVETAQGKPGSLKGGKLQLIASYIGAKVQGDIYEFTNTSKELVFLKQRDLYQMGVRAVSIVDANVYPNATTRVFVMRDKT